MSSSAAATPSATGDASASAKAVSADAVQSTSSNGESNAPAHATTLLNLEVKVLTQALGVENQWVERGDGRVEFVDLTIRVLAPASAKKEDSEEGGAARSSDTTKKAHKNHNGSEDAASDVASTASTVDDQDLVDTVILEDTITCDTPFVGENCCIVWNSFEQQLSLCLMYASEEGYGASWSALVALQEKAYPPLRFDLLDTCVPMAKGPDGADGDGGAAASTPTTEAKTADDGAASPNAPVQAGGEPLPYSCFIHTLYDPPLGFIDMHALSLSILENNHTSNPKLFECRDTVVDMLRLASADLLDHLLTPEVFPRLLAAVSPARSTIRGGSSGGERDKPAGTAVGLSDADVPDALTKLEVPENLASFIAKERRLRKLQDVLIPSLGRGAPVKAPPTATRAPHSSSSTTAASTVTRDANTELLLKLSAMLHRLRNEVVCTLLSSDTTLSQARDALTVAPPANVNGGNVASTTGAGRGRLSSDSTSSMHSARSADRLSSPSNVAPAAAAAAASSAAVTEAQRVEKSVLAHLRFFRSLMVISMIELGRELVGPVIAKVFHFGLLEALSLVAERFAMPAGSTALFLAKLREGSGVGGGDGSTTQPFPPQSNRNSLSNNNMNGSGTTNSSSNNAASPVYYSPAIEAELTAFLDATLVRLNERQEERLMNELVRSPVLTDPIKYNGLMTFALRQVLFGNGTANASSASSAAASSSSSSARPVLRDTAGVRTTLLLFHLLGLHDDEGSAAMERALDPQGTDLRDRFHTFVLDKYLSHTMRGQIAIPPAPSLAPVASGSGIGGVSSLPSSNHRGASSAMSTMSGSSSPKRSFHVPNSVPGNSTGSNAIVVFNNVASGGVSGNGVGGIAHHHEFANSLAALPAGVSPAFISILNYLIVLCNPSNRDRTLRLIFDPKSNVLSYMETCCAVAVNSKTRLIGLDVLASQVRFLKTMLTEVGNSCGDDVDNGAASPPGDSNPLPSFENVDPLPSNLVTLICRQLTVERDTLWYYLRAFNTLGGLRRCTMFHSSVLSLLDLIARGPMPRGEPVSQEEINRRVVSEDTVFHDMRSFVFMKHEATLPERFTRKVRDSLLSEVCSRLGCEDVFSSCNNSSSALSSTINSEMLRSSTKLRFVDELEAATGGVDGTVAPNTVTALTPAVVASVSAEEKRRKISSGSRGVTLEAKLQSGTAHNSPLRPVGVLSSPPGLAPLQNHLAPAATGQGGPGGSGSRALLTPPKNASHVGAATSPTATGTAAARDVGNVAMRLQLTASSSPPPTVTVTVPQAVTDMYLASSPTGTTPGVGSSTNSSSAVLQPTAPKGEKPSTRSRKLTGGAHDDEPVVVPRPNSVGPMPSSSAFSSTAAAAATSGDARAHSEASLARNPKDTSTPAGAAEAKGNGELVDGRKAKRAGTHDAPIGKSTLQLNKTAPLAVGSNGNSSNGTAAGAGGGKGAKTEPPSVVLPRVRKSNE